MTTINNVDFSDVANQAADAARLIISDNWDEVKDIIKNITDGLTNDVSFIAKKKLSGEFNENDAKVFMEDQKMLARIRLRSLAIISLQLAENIWNAIADTFRAAINRALGWTVL